MDTDERQVVHRQTNSFEESEVPEELLFALAPVLTGTQIRFFRDDDSGAAFFVVQDVPKRATEVREVSNRFPMGPARPNPFPRFQIQRKAQRSALGLQLRRCILFRNPNHNLRIMSHAVRKHMSMDSIKRTNSNGNLKLRQTINQRPKNKL